MNTSLYFIAHNDISLCNSIARKHKTVDPIKSANDSYGLYSLNGRTFYRQISWSLDALKLDIIMIVSLPNIESMMTSSNGNIFRVTGPLCGEFTGPGEFPTQRPVTRSFDVSLDLRLNKRLNKHSRGWWFETLSRPFWRHRNVISAALLPKCLSNFRTIKKVWLLRLRDFMGSYGKTSVRSVNRSPVLMLFVTDIFAYVVRGYCTSTPTTEKATRRTWINGSSKFIKNWWYQFKTNKIVDDETTYTMGLHGLIICFVLGASPHLGADFWHHSVCRCIGHQQAQ